MDPARSAEKSRLTPWEIREQKIDAVLEGTFPTSDPPAWGSLVREPAPAAGKDAERRGRQRK